MALSRLTEVTDIFTTALPMRASAIDGHAGEQAISASVTATPALPCGMNQSRGARQPSPATSTVRESEAGVEPAVSMVRSIRHLHHQRRLSRAMRGKPKNKIVLSRRLERCAAIANPLGPALPSVSSLRLVPSDRPRACGHAPAGTSLGIRVSRSGLRRDVQTSRASDNKKPSGAFGSGGFAATGPISVRLCEIAPMSQACAIDWRIAIR